MGLKFAAAPDTQAAATAKAAHDLAVQAVADADAAAKRAENARQMVLSRDTKLNTAAANAADAVIQYATLEQLAASYAAALPASQQDRAALHAEVDALKIAVAENQTTPGPQGETGATGATGSTGAQGVRGPSGVDGVQGATGLPGAKGDVGTQGIAGAAGLVGPAGPAGATGPAGSKGDTGATGATGATGLTGPAGAKGDNGATGAQGVAGPAGTAGTNATVRNGATAGLALKVYTDVGTSNAAGAVTFTIPAGYFTALIGAPVLEVVRDSANPTAATFCMQRTVSATSITGQCFESKSTGVLLLNTMVEGLETCSSAQTVRLTAFGV